MSHIFITRGWLEGDAPEIDSCVSVIQRMKAHQASSDYQWYLDGWVCPENHRGFIFYGGEHTRDGVDFLREVVEEMLKITTELGGYFHIQSMFKEENYELVIRENTAVFQETTCLTETFYTE